MTDKNETDQNKDALSDAFTRLKQSEKLEPSAELDALILQQASDAVFGSTQARAAFSVDDEQAKAKNTEKSTGKSSDVSDLSFRRKLMSEQKKRSVIPRWAMPIGIAATVLLSFGVVNRVLLSPEFKDIGTQSSSAPVYSDSEIVSEDGSVVDALEPETGQGKLKENTANKPSDQSITPESIEQERAREKAREKNASVEMELMESQAVQRRLPQKLENIAEPETPELVAATPEVRADTSSKRDTSMIGTSSSTAAVGEAKQQEVKPLRAESPASEVVVASSPVSPSFDIPQGYSSLGDVASEDDQLSEVQNADLDVSAAEVAEPKEAELQTVEEVVLTGARLSTNKEPAKKESTKKDTTLLFDLSKQTDSMELEEVIVEAAPQEPEFGVEEVLVDPTLDDPMIKENVITEVLFEHRQCQVKYDCLLVALDCDGCDCTEAVNATHYDEYDTKLFMDDIARKCSNQSVDCVSGYCQVEYE